MKNDGLNSVFFRYYERQFLGRMGGSAYEFTITGIANQITMRPIRANPNLIYLLLK
jgi:hypothetical protein